MSLHRHDFESLENVRIIGENRDWSVEGVSIDSRRIQSTDAFFALAGDKTDGHEFILEVFQKGVRVAVAREAWVAQHPVSLPADGWLVQVPDPLVALQSLARNWRKKMELPVIAIGGSNGKTTTKDMVAAVLTKKFEIMKTEGNFNNHIGLPLTVLRIGAAHQAAVIEMGENHLRELALLCGIARPTHGLLTNIGHDHLGEFGNFENNLRAKSELIEWIVKNKGTMFINRDDKNITLAFKQLKSDVGKKLKMKITYGKNKPVGIHGKIISVQKDGCLSLNIEGTHLTLRIPGQHQIDNALAAWAVGTHFGVPRSGMKEALENFESPSQRMQILKIGKMIILNDCYNANPESMIAALETLQTIQTGEKGRKIAILGDMLELGSYSQEEHRKLGQFVAKQKIDCLFTFGELTQYTASEAIKNRLVNVQHYTDKQKLAGYLKEFLNENDAVLVKGSRGMMMEEIIEKLKR